MACSRSTSVEFVARRENVLLLRGSGGIDGGWIDLTMRLGRLKKTVRLSENIPSEFRRLVDRVLGPEAVWRLTPVPGAGFLDSGPFWIPGPWRDDNTV
jgi:hypothetical protein